MKEEKKKWETVIFSFSEDQILRELTAESSYVAKSLVGTAELQAGVEPFHRCQRGGPSLPGPLALPMSVTR